MIERDDKVLSVSALTRFIKELLEDGFSEVTVEGEISNFKAASSGHWYFNLKDREAMIQVVMFRASARNVAFDPADGSLVRVSGGVSVYEARGQYQIIARRMEAAGEGKLLAILEDRKRRLAAEGLFDPVRKRPLPRFPSRVAVVTSPTGAAIHDILTVLGRRNAGIDIVVIPAAVQGEAAPRELVRGIMLANLYHLGEVIIIGRGGGSLEDLLAFSDEELVRAVAASELPVISAVGHEIDWALSDFAADLRAPTPSAAAELVSESGESLRDEAAQLKGELQTGIRVRLDAARSVLARFEPEAIDGRFMRLLHPMLRGLDEAKAIIENGMRKRLVAERHRLELALGRIEASSPEAILERGYSIVRDERGAPIRNAQAVERGAKVAIQFSKGSATARVEEIGV
ncbi:MAG: exodeoxyribonuclease VII large subunit [Treponema sp.]|nr:exodeoxyribonuclease VII large subunit [Treponema sp.]